MTRGVPRNPRPKAPDAYIPFAFSTFPGAITAINAKNVASSFLKADAQSHWFRRIADADYDQERKEKRRKLNGSGTNDAVIASQQKSQSTEDDPASKVIVIHPGSRLLRIGRASDVIPLTAANVIARRLKGPNAKQKARASPTSIDTTLDDKIESIRTEIKNRMKHFKIRHGFNNSSQAIQYNETVHPEIIPEFNDPLRMEWTDTEDAKDEFIVGEHALKIANPEEAGFVLRWPLSRGTFNTENYASSAEVLADIQDILTSILTVDFECPPTQYADCSVILIIPDLYDAVYLREMTNLLLRTMGFKQLCVQQESLCVTFGAGLSAACVVDIGATKCSIACVEDGAVLPESRISLSFGGDDITTFFFQNLLRLQFPCKDIDLSRTCDWQLIEALKETISTLQEMDVAFNLYNVDVRRPNLSLKKYSFKLFDEAMISPMALFAPHVVRFDLRPLAKPLWAPKESQEEAVELGTDAITSTMRTSVKQVFLPPAATNKETSRQENTAMDVDSTTNSPKIVPQYSTLEFPDSFVEANSGKVPLDIAIVESLASSGLEDRIKRFCSSVIVVGGGARMNGISWAVQSRVGGYIAQRFPTFPTGAVHLTPSPRDIDPQILAWKGVSVLNQLEVCSELWIRADDYAMLGMKALKDRIMLFSA